MAWLFENDYNKSDYSSVYGNFDFDFDLDVNVVGYSGIGQPEPQPAI